MAGLRICMLRTITVLFHDKCNTTTASPNLGTLTRVTAAASRLTWIQDCTSDLTASDDSSSLQSASQKCIRVSQCDAGLN